MTNLIERIPPQNIEAEQAVLGAMLLERVAIVKALPILNAEDFYRQLHRDIYQAITKVFNKENCADMILVNTAMKINDANFDASYPALLLSMAPSASGVAYYAKLVKDAAVKRNLIRINDEIMNEAYKPEVNAVDLMESMEKRVFNLSMNCDTSDGFVSHYEVGKKIFNEVDDLRNGGEKKPGIKTGISYFDHMTGGGLRPGQVMILAAGTSSGKTALAANIALYVAQKYGTVAYFSYEMEPEELLYRLISHKSGITQDCLRNIDISEDEMITFSQVIESWTGGSLKLDKTKCPSVSQMKSRCRKLKMEVGLKLIVIDYIAQIPNGGGNERERISKISREVKLMAMELQVPILALSQLNRSSMDRSPRRPQMHDLKETSALEQDADIVGLLYRPGFYGREELIAADYNPDTQKNITELMITKHRAGKVGTFKLIFDGETSTFYPYREGENNG
jgi:replicative DNA helicase